MDVYLSSEAYEYLQAQSLTATPQNADGLIFGHKRGPSFFVEKILPSIKGFFPSLEIYFALNNLFNDKLLGFYSFHTEKNKTRKILAPFAFGKLYLDIQMTESKVMKVKPFLIEYDKNFFLAPLQLKPPQPKK